MKLPLLTLPLSKTLAVGLVSVIGLGGATYAYTRNASKDATPAIPSEVAQSSPDISPTPSESPSESPSANPAAVATPTPDPSPTATATPSKSKQTATPKPTATATVATTATPTAAPTALPTPRDGYSLYTATNYRLFYPSIWEGSGSGNTFNASYQIEEGYTFSLQSSIVSASYASALANQRFMGTGVPQTETSITVNGHEGVKFVAVLTMGSDVPMNYVEGRIYVKLSDTSYMFISISESKLKSNPPQSFSLYTAADVDDLLDSILFL